MFINFIMCCTLITLIIMYVHHIVNGFYSNGNKEFKIVNAKMNWLYVLVDFTIGFDIIKHKRSSSDNYFKNIFH